MTSKNTNSQYNKTCPFSVLDPPSLLIPFSLVVDALGVFIFDCFLGTLPERLLSDLGAQKASKMKAFGGSFADLFRKRKKCDF